MPKPTPHTSPHPLDPVRASKVLCTIVQMATTMEMDLRKVGLFEEAHLIGIVRASAEQRLDALGDGDGTPSPA